MKSQHYLAMMVGIASIPATSAVAQPATPEYQADVRPDADFPDPTHATRKKGAFVAPANIGLIAPGLTKKQVYTLMDVPHFHEALFGERKWDYILNFYTGTEMEYVSCQFQITFDKHAKVDAAYWRSDTCLSYMGTLTETAPLSSVPPVTMERVFEPGLAEKRYAVNFAFNSAELSPEALASLESITRQAAQGTKGITITGHTDTSGSEAYNYGLSLERAKAVAAALEQMGLNRSSYSIVAQGEHDLAVPTGDGVKDVRNRRSQVIISF